MFQTTVVHYLPNGKIVPVNPNGNPIPNAPTPQYPTDSNNPTKVVPNEPVPVIPGYTPSESTVTPVDPGQDTPVVYTKVSTPNGQPTSGQPTTPTQQPGQQLGQSGQTAMPVQQPGPMLTAKAVKTGLTAQPAQQNGTALPQTGNQTNQLAAVGMGVMMSAGLLGLAGLKKKEDKN